MVPLSSKLARTASSPGRAEAEVPLFLPLCVLSIMARGSCSINNTIINCHTTCLQGMHTVALPFRVSQKCEGCAAYIVVCTAVVGVLRITAQPACLLFSGAERELIDRIPCHPQSHDPTQSLWSQCRHESSWIDSNEAQGWVQPRKCDR